MGEEQEKIVQKTNKKPMIAIVVLLAVAVIGATIAYYMSSASFTNIFTAGEYKVVSEEVFESPQNWKPGEEIPKTVTTSNEGTIPAAVRVTMTEKWEDKQGNDITSQIDEGTVIINLDNTIDWTKVRNYYYYNYILEPGDETNSYIKSVTLNPALNGVECTTSQDGLTKTCEGKNKATGAVYKLTITKETVQASKYKTVWPDAPDNIRNKPVQANYTNASNVVYFDPVSNYPCDSSTFSPSDIANGDSTCYKWYVLNEKGTNTTLLLDHAIDTSKWDTSERTTNGPRTILNTLKNDTSTWTRVPLLDYEYDTSILDDDGYGVMTCTNGSCSLEESEPFVTDLRARLITTEEFAAAMCQTGDYNFETGRYCETTTLEGVDKGREYLSNRLFLTENETNYPNFGNSIKWLTSNHISWGDNEVYGITLYDDDDYYDAEATISPADSYTIWTYDDSELGYENSSSYMPQGYTYAIRPVIFIPTSLIN